MNRLAGRTGGRDVDGTASGSPCSGPETGSLLARHAGGGAVAGAGGSTQKRRSNTDGSRGASHRLAPSGGWRVARTASCRSAQTATAAGDHRQASNLRGMRHEVVTRTPGQKGFAVLPRRWVVERSFVWLTHWGGLLRGRPGRHRSPDQSSITTLNRLLVGGCLVPGPQPSSKPASRSAAQQLSSSAAQRIPRTPDARASRCPTYGSEPFFVPST